jgi:hypothetical protein
MDIYHHYREILNIRKDYTFERPSITTQDIIKDNKIIERELLREKLYNNVLQSLKTHMTQYKSRNRWGDKEFNHLLLRYILNKIITKTDNDDPIFIYNTSKYAENQLIMDKNYSGLNFDPSKLMAFLDNLLKLAYDTLTTTNIPNDDIPTLNNNKIVYKGIEYDDISDLGKNNPNYLSYALALNIRYKYIHLESHGLAREYELMGFGKDDACEAFASAFNHYFNTYCSAFPDLERPFGSLGSFFNQNLDTWNKYIVFVNPPFDLNLMDVVFEKITHFLQEAENRRLQSNKDTTNVFMEFDHHYILTVPNWPDWEGLYNFKMNKWMYMAGIYLKGALPFINHMDNSSKQIFPSDIAELFCRNPLK